MTFREELQELSGIFQLTIKSLMEMEELLVRETLRESQHKTATFNQLQRQVFSTQHAGRLKRSALIERFDKADSVLTLYMRRI